MLQTDRETKVREEILKWISVSDTEKQHNIIRRPRVADTGLWLLNTKTFVRWRDSEESPNVLWCRGIQGSGKSVLTWVNIRP